MGSVESPIAVHFSTNSGIWASPAAESGAVRIGSIRDKAPGPRHVFALPPELVSTRRHEDRVVLLMTELGALVADCKKAPHAIRFPEQLAALAAKACACPVSSPIATTTRYRSAPVLPSEGSDRQHRAAHHPGGIVVSCECSCLLREKKAPAIAAASTSFNDARICQSGLRLANSAANAQRWMLYLSRRPRHRAGAARRDERGRGSPRKCHAAADPCRHSPMSASARSQRRVTIQNATAMRFEPPPMPRPDLLHGRAPPASAASADRAAS